MYSIQSLNSYACIPYNLRPSVGPFYIKVWSKAEHSPLFPTRFVFQLLLRCIIAPTKEALPISGVTAFGDSTRQCANYVDPGRLAGWVGPVISG